MINDYDSLFSQYKKTDVKPDKLYSMLPTIFKISKPLRNKTVIDVGCGDGFFTSSFAKKAKIVYGIDNSKNQIEEAMKHVPKNIIYEVEDMLKYNYPKSDRIHISFVLGYLKEEKELLIFFKRLYKSLNKKGKIFGIIDSPKYLVHNNKDFGSIKKLKSFKEGEKLIIELYNEKKKLVTLNAYYHTKEIIEKTLCEAGFSEIRWIFPKVSSEGMKKFGKKYWKNYLNQIDIEYFSASK